MMKGSYRLFICLLTALNISIARAQVNDTIPSQRTDTLTKPTPSSVITDEIRQEPYDLLQLADDIARTEWEIEIPLTDTEALLKLCHGGIIDKTRYIVPEGGTLSGRFFEVDEFYGDNEGLVMAEIELENASDAFEKPSWLGQEVTGDRHYYNSYLSMHPFKTW